VCKASAKLHAIGRLWACGSFERPPTKLCHLLLHEYAGSFSFDALKGKDADVVAAVRATGTFAVYVVRVEFANDDTFRDDDAEDDAVREWTSWRFHSVVEPPEQEACTIRTGPGWEVAERGLLR
jgi:hypothetical protein